MIEPGRPVLAFGPRLQEFRRRAGLTGTAVAAGAGIDPSYLNRLEHSEREPPRREVVLGLARALTLSPHETDILLVAAGYLPEPIQQLGALDPTLLLLATLLADGAIPAAERGELRQIVHLVARRWRPDA